MVVKLLSVNKTNNICIKLDLKTDCYSLPSCSSFSDVLYSQGNCGGRGGGGDVRDVPWASAEPFGESFSFSSSPLVDGVGTLGVGVARSTSSTYRNIKYTLSILY